MRAVLVAEVCKGYCCGLWEVVLVVGGSEGCTSRVQLLVGVERVALNVGVVL